MTHFLNYFKMMALVTALFTMPAKLMAAPPTDAEYRRFALSGGVGVTQLAGSNQASVSAGLEFEYRLEPMWGVGAFGSYVFASPGIAQIGFPQVYLHPLGGDWYINAAPIAQFGGAAGTQFGLRVGTRAPLHFGVFMIVPQVAIDFIGGGRNLMFGIGIGVQ
jgi:hypothetical protein